MKEYAKDFYKSKAWHSARQQAINKANGLCERCKAKGEYVPGYIVHHKTYVSPKNINNKAITLDINNLEYLCEDCHNKEHKSIKTTRYIIGKDGKLLPPTPPGVHI